MSGDDKLREIAEREEAQDEMLVNLNAVRSSEEPAAKPLPLGHEYQNFGDGYDSCAITYCGEPESAHRASEEEHRKHPTGDYCTWCHSQWPCEESQGISERGDLRNSIKVSNGPVEPGFALGCRFAERVK